MLRPMIGAEQELMDQETVLPKAGVFIINRQLIRKRPKRANNHDPNAGDDKGETTEGGGEARCRLHDPSGFRRWKRESMLPQMDLLK